MKERITAACIAWLCVSSAALIVNAEERGSVYVLPILVWRGGTFPQTQMRAKRQVSLRQSGSRDMQTTLKLNPDRFNQK